MDHFHYKDNELHCEDVPVARIAEAHGTPAHVYSRRTFLDHFDRIKSAFAEADPTICYSIKSCHNINILRMLAEHGSSFDVVSGGELARALEAGADPKGMVFAGVGKTEEEIRRGLECGIGWFNVESEQELELIERIATGLNLRANVAIRVNPDVDAHTHEHTTTGRRENKFGVDFARARRLFETHRDSKYVRMSGLHVHIGSPVNRVEPLVEAVTKAIELIESLRSDGFVIDALNIGGGFGAYYEGSEAPTAARYAEAIIPVLRGRGLRLILEPGRSIAGNAGILIGRVLYIKRGVDRRFVITDAAMTELLRPALYGAYHFAWPVRPANGLVPPYRGRDLELEGTQLMDVVGPVCESGDFLARDRMLPPMEQGDLIAVFTTGAYGSVMASHYNSRPQAPEVLVDGQTFRLIRRRETYEDLVALERA